MNSTKDRVEFANTLRGFAALFVILSHYFNVFWYKREAVASLTFAPVLPNTFGIPVYVAAIQPPSAVDYGGFGVSLFFLISGFVIPFSLERATVLQFVASRFFRLTPVYVVGFSVTLGSIWLSTWYFGGIWPFTLGEVLSHWLPGFRDIFWSRPIDGIAWTLEIEVKFYLVCALSASLIRRQSAGIFLVPIAIAMFAYLAFPHLAALQAVSLNLYRGVFIFCYAAPFLVYMFIGTIAHFLYKGAVPAKFGLPLVAALFAIFCTMIWTGVHRQIFEMVWTYGIAVIVFFLAYGFREKFERRRLFDFFANISYPLYVVHGVSGYILIRIMLDQGFRASISLLLATLASITLAWVLHRFIEKPSLALGKRWTRNTATNVIATSPSSAAA